MRRAPLARLVFASLLSTVAPWAAAGGSGTPIPVYVGTYTDTGSRGIYRFTLDPQTGQASEPGLAAEAQNPSFLALHPNGRFLYAVGETESFDGRKSGAVSAFAIDAKTGALTRLNQRPSEGAGPCHLLVDPSGRNVLVANYGGGTLAVLPIAADGRLEPAASVQAHQGTGPNPTRQEKPHAHGVVIDATGRHAVAADLGADRLFVYGFDAAAGRLTPVGAAALEPGAGPRHLAFDAGGRRLFVINELSSTITSFSYDPQTAALQAVQTVSTLPSGFRGANTTAELVLSPDGRFLYGSNRGHDSIAVFAVDAASGRLTPAGHVSAGGATPRHFAIDPSGRLLLVAHQGSDSISVFRLDPASGQPAPTGARLKLAKPVCLLPVPPAR